MIYTVVKGDTLWGIAKKHLGKASRYVEIVQMNGIKTSVLYAGQMLRLPMHKGGTDMSDNTKIKIALAEAITTQLWVRGLITRNQREQIDNRSREILVKKD